LVQLEQLVEQPIVVVFLQLELAAHEHREVQ